MGYNSLQTTVVIPGVGHGCNEIMKVYVGLNNGCRMIWEKLCGFSQYRTMHMQ
jgi:hypothetical protein